MVEHYIALTTMKATFCLQGGRFNDELWRKILIFLEILQPEYWAKFRADLIYTAFGTVLGSS